MKMRILEMGDGKYIPQVKVKLFSPWLCVGYHMSERIFPDQARYRPKDKMMEFCKKPTLEEAGQVLVDYKNDVAEELKAVTVSRTIEIVGN